MNFRRSWVTSGILIIIDIGLGYLIFRSAYLIRSILIPILGPLVEWVELSQLTQLGILLIVSIFIIQGLYPGFGMTAVKELEKIGISVTLAFVLLASTSYLYKAYNIFSRATMLLAWGIALFLLPIMHFVIRNIISRFK